LALSLLLAWKYQIWNKEEKDLLCLRGDYGHQELFGLVIQNKEFVSQKSKD
jgi:ABC-type transporter Mla MlaB component